MANPKPGRSPGGPFGAAKGGEEAMKKDQQ